MIRLFAVFRHCRKLRFFKVRFVGEFPSGRDTACTVIMLAGDSRNTPSDDLKRMIELQTGAERVVVLTLSPI